jgi:hypothetical protein
MSPPLDHHFAGGGGIVAIGKDLKETELSLRLGLPGSEPKEKKVGLTLDLLPTKGFSTAGAKRGFSDAIDNSSGLRENGGVLFSNAGSAAGSGSKAEANAAKEKGPAK